MGQWCIFATSGSGTWERNNAKADGIRVVRNAAAGISPKGPYPVKIDRHSYKKDLALEKITAIKHKF
jgi:hypothetical protein